MNKFVCEKNNKQTTHGDSSQTTHGDSSQPAHGDSSFDGKLGRFSPVDHAERNDSIEDKTKDSIDVAESPNSVLDQKVMHENVDDKRSKDEFRAARTKALLESSRKGPSMGAMTSSSIGYGNPSPVTQVLNRVMEYGAYLHTVMIG